MNYKELFTLIEDKINKQRIKCDKLEEKIEILKDKELDEKQPKLDELQNKIINLKKQHSKMVKTEKTFDNMVKGSFVANLAVCSVCLLLNVLWILSLCTVTLSSLVVSGVLYKKYKVKAENITKEINELSETREMLLEEKSEELFNMECKLIKEYFLLDKLNKEKDILVNSKRLNKEKEILNKKYSQNTKLNEDEIEI